MRATLRYIFALILAIVLFATLVFPCVAVAQEGKITVTLEDKDNNEIDGITVYLCQIAELDNTGYNPTKAFENSGISISGIADKPDETAAKAVSHYVKNNNVKALSATAKNGKASFSNLNLGIWVIYCESNGKYTFNPYIVFLPFKSGEEQCYEVTSAPKIDDNNPDAMNIYVIKKWDDKSNSAKKRPNSVTVELLNGDVVVSSTELNEENGWAHTFLNCSKNGEYSVREKNVADYKASYSGDATNGFVVTNIYTGQKLPQTGQYWWPLVIISISGVCFILLGVYEIGIKKNGKNK